MAPDAEKKVYMVQLIEFVPALSSSTKKGSGLALCREINTLSSGFLVFYNSDPPAKVTLSVFPFVSLPLLCSFFSFSAALQLHTQIIFSLPLLFNLAASA